MEVEATASASVEEAPPAVTPSLPLEIEPVAVDAAEMRRREQPRSFLQKLRDWLRRDT